MVGNIIILQYSPHTRKEKGGEFERAERSIDSNPMWNVFSMHHLYSYYSKIKFIVHLNHHCLLFCLKLKEPSKFYVPINCVYPTTYDMGPSRSLPNLSMFFQVKPIQIHCPSPLPLLSIAEEAIFDHCVLGQIPTSWLKYILSWKYYL